MSVRRGLFTVYWLIIAPVSVLIGLGWFMSPIGLGFLEWPQQEPLKSLTIGVLNFSFFVALPILAIALAASPLLARTRWRRIAFIAPLAALAALVSSAAFVLAALN